MRAVYFPEPKRILLKNVDKPKLGLNDVLVRVVVCGVCGSDIPLYLHTQKGWNPSLIPGHEVAGEVSEIGDSVREYQMGDRVVIYSGVPCGGCFYCKAGLENYCLALTSFQRDGGYAEFQRVSEKQLLKLPDSISFEDGSLLLDPIGVPVEGLKRIGGVLENEKVAVYGCGTIGLGTILTLQSKYKAKEIFAVEPSEYRLRIAEDFGAIAVNPTKRYPPRELIRATDNLGVDLAIDATGNNLAEINAIKSVKRLGKVLFLGENYGQISISPSDLIIEKGLTLAGSRYFPIAAFKENVDILQRSRGRFCRINTHEFPLEQVTEAYRLFLAKKCIRPLLRPCSK